MGVVGRVQYPAPILDTRVAVPVAERCEVGIGVAGTELGNGAPSQCGARDGSYVRMAEGACGSAAALPGATCSSRRLLPAPAVIVVCSALSPLPATMPPSFLSFFHMVEGSATRKCKTVDESEISNPNFQKSRRDEVDVVPLRLR